MWAGLPTNQRLLLQHGVNLRLCTEENTPQVHLVDEIKVRGIENRCVAEAHGPSHVGTIIDPPKNGNGLVHHRLDRFLVAHVDGDSVDMNAWVRGRDGGFCALQEREVDVGNYDARTAV